MVTVIPLVYNLVTISLSLLLSHPCHLFPCWERLIVFSRSVRLTLRRGGSGRSVQPAGHAVLKRASDGLAAAKPSDRDLPLLAHKTAVPDLLRSSPLLGSLKTTCILDLDFGGCEHASTTAARTTHHSSRTTPYDIRQRASKTAQLNAASTASADKNPNPDFGPCFFLTPIWHHSSPPYSHLQKQTQTKPNRSKWENRGSNPRKSFSFSSRSSASSSCSSSCSSQSSSRPGRCGKWQRRWWRRIRNPTAGGERAVQGGVERRGLEEEHWWTGRMTAG
ncbi:hypothetical protein BU26DRAFT_151532 [Trematosphaeria pertusa]|uniref:Uncharacterized protein n=1 Tax=Trematosphaeria pertusa TaxID=390896 RepID=A0A6A6IYN0_9PLEO|nr:uncharacterized protein BU26DRAFT_151532 [Trematosphaeria pertusa]KAF2255157.1 hypothetical protein BU26DRAFT_151532 [Trematosphaeria pertusa]